MPTLHLTTPGLRVQLEGDRLVIHGPADGEPIPDVARYVHLREVERAFVSSQVSISLASLCRMAERDAPVVVLDGIGRVLALIQPPAPNGVARLAQYQRASDPAFRLAVSATLVEAKILNQKRVLQRLAANRELADITSTTLALGRIAQTCVSAASLETLRGYEGTAAGRYFEAYGSFFPEEAPFERRSKRPPHNAVNAVLSFAYTHLAVEAEAFLHGFGLDPAVGCFHDVAERRASLALDLIEPFRAPVADALALDTISHGILKPDRHFEPRNGGIYLNREGRKLFAVQYERRMEREFTSEQRKCRTTLRNELQHQARALRDALLEGNPFEPFLMN